MARETQGLQVLLIVFVMLTVVLGVTTYLYTKRADEATKAVVAADVREQQAKEETKAKDKECEILKTLIGSPGKSTEEIRKQFNEDMDAYGGEKKLASETDKAGADKLLFDPSTRYYRRLLEGMNKVIQDRTDELIRSRSLVAELERQYKNRDADKEKTVADLTARYGELDVQTKKIAADYTVAQQATQAESALVAGRVEKIRRDAATATAAALETEKNAKKAVQAKEAEVRELARQRNQIERQDMDVPSGEITWVSLPNKMVWINRGRADALQRQTKFTVYSADSTNAAKAVRKATVEVTQIDGDHSAQARILDDKLADPIMAGDKVFTPLWSPGQQNHFALTGIMNLDGDGRNQLGIVRGLVNQNGGVVDCWLDEHGQRQGQITANTRFIVVGDSPDKSSSEFVKNHGAILSDAEHYQVRKMTLTDFKQQMGYQKSSSVEHFGSGPSPRP